MKRRLLMPVGLVIVIGMAVSACGESRPTVGNWEAEWDQAVSMVPDQEFITEDQSEKCEQALVSLRTHRDNLFPTPDPAIDETVTVWVETVESTFFDCPTGAALQDAYAELFRLQEEIETVVAIDS